jgi:hypothetical protein
MKHPLSLCIVFTLASVVSSTMLAQTVGEYRTARSGNWSAAATWQRWNGTVWAAATSAPTGSETITIQATDSLHFDTAMTITGTVRSLSGRVTVFDSSRVTFGNGGVYEHAVNGGTLPKVVWGTSSTLLLTGVTANAPSNSNQDFYNVTFNTPNLSSNLNMGWRGNTIKGNIRVVNTGSSSRWQMSAPQSAGDTVTITIQGAIRVEGGHFSSNGTSTNSHFRVHQHGNVRVTGGNFSVSRGSQGGGSTLWYLYGDTVSLSNATTQNSNAAGARFIFARQGIQHLLLSSVTFGGGGMPIEVAAGSTLDMGVSKLRGNGLFRLSADATLATAEPGGIDSTIGTTGTITFNSGASYIFNGTAKQVTGMTLPDTVKNLTIDNAAGVVLSRSTVINGFLRLRRGEFDNTVPFKLGPTGSIAYEGGTLRNPMTSVEQLTGLIPQSFFVEQNYPNPFNPATTIRFGLPASAHVSVNVYTLLGQRVASLYEGVKEAGTYVMRFEASHLPSGVYLFRVQAGTQSSVKRMILMK